MNVIEAVGKPQKTIFDPLEHFKPSSVNVEVATDYVMRTLPCFFKKPILFFLLLFLSGSDAFASKDLPSIFDVMTGKEVLHLELSADFQSIKENRLKDFIYPASLSFQDAAGKVQEWKLRLKVRGAFRRVRCADKPPLRLDFSKFDLKAAGLAPFDHLKLVTQCMLDPEKAPDCLLREYLIYKMYNELSQYSFRVQLLRITYKDVRSGHSEVQWAFLIEDFAQLRHRTGSQKVDETNCFNLPAAAFDREQFEIVAMFEYFIGNTDWNTTTMRNLKLMQLHGKLVAVPYDFDFSGIVNAPYATVNVEYQMSLPRGRLYLGFPEAMNDPHMAQSVLLGHRVKIQEIVRKFRLLSPASRRDMLRYIEEYYECIEVIQPAERVVRIGG